VSLNLIVEVMLPLALLVAAGGAWTTFFPALPAERLRSVLVGLVFTLFAPALMFSIAATTRIDRALFAVPLLMSLGILCSGALVYLLLYRTRIGRGLTNRARAALILAGAFGNIFYMGLPVLSFLYADNGPRYAAFADMLASTPLLWSAGVWVALHLGADEPRSSKGAWHAWMRLPLVWGFALGLALNLSGFDLAPLVRAARFIGQATVPLMLFVLGLSISWRQLHPGRAAFVIVGVKLFAGPAIVWGLAAMFGVASEPARAAIVEAAMPTMLFALVLADRFSLDTRAVALVIGWSTVLFWFTLPLWLTLSARM